jgi:predicted transcriptional regulator
MTLGQYLTERKIPHATFADQIGVSQAAVTRYVAGDRMPRQKVLSRIREATGGLVAANDFFPAAEDAA